MARRTPEPAALVAPFDKFGEGDVALVGGKGASLVELVQRGLPVPPGLVVTTQAFHLHLRRPELARWVARLSAALISGDEQHALRVAAGLRRAIVAAPFPFDLRAQLSRFQPKTRTFAVRSSATLEDGATHSWAGQFDTFLDVPRSRLERDVKRCWASLWGERAVAYGLEQKSVGTPGMAVIIQSMVNATAAGVAFSLHPVTQNREQVVLECVHGLGEAVVGGEVTPERVVVAKRDGWVVGRSPHPQTRALVPKQGGGVRWVRLPAQAHKPVLAPPELRTLTRHVLSLEQVKGTAVDVEWAVSGTARNRRVQILQCRPVTASSEAAPIDATAIRWRFIHRRARSPFLLALMAGGVTEYLNEIGFDYRWKRIGAFNDAIAIQSQEFDDMEQRLLRLRQKDPAWPLRTMALCERQWALTCEQLKGLWRPGGAGERSEVMADALIRYERAMHRFNAFGSWPLALEGPLTAELKERLLRRFKGDWPEAFAAATNPVDSGIILQQQLALLALADKHRRGRSISKALRVHAERFGWMKNAGYFGEWYPASHYEQEVARLALGDPLGEAQEIRRTQRNAKRTLGDWMRRAGKDSLLSKLMRTANSAVAFRSFRTELYYESYRFVRPLLERVAKRLDVSASDVFFLYPDEMERCLRTSASADAKLISQRRKGFIWVSDFAGAYTTYSGDQVQDQTPDFDSVSDVKVTELTGEPAFAGRASGRAVVVHRRADLAEVRDGDILVTHATTIDFVPALRKVAAIVTEEGGILCHAAVISRELRIPAVLGTRTATSVFRTNERLEVDSRAGVVRRLS